jgi:uncharacterized protein (DUF1800 family)
MLHIRFGYGIGPNVEPVTAEALLAAAAGPDRAAVRYPVLAFSEAMTLEAVRQAAHGPAMKQVSEAVVRMERARNAIRRSPNEALAAALARILDGDAPLRERLTWFWADHFTTVARNEAQRAGSAGYVDEAIRPFVMGRFADMLKAVIRHPAMLLYLDQSVSVGPDSGVGQGLGRGLNENLAREMMELHTLGVGDSYTQTDVREAAELLTGLTIDRSRAFVFRPALAQPGPERVLGKDYGSQGPARLEDIDALLEDLAIHPTTARHLAHKLAVHFFAEDPPPALVRDLEVAFLESRGDLGQVTATLVRHPAMRSDAFHKIKPPMDFIASTLLALGLRGADMVAMARDELSQTIAGPMKDMGQPFLWASGPDGWPEAADDWVTPQGLARRIGWAVWTARLRGQEIADPRDFLERTLPGIAGEPLRFAVSAAETREDGIALVLASPEFNRR